jgi:beta-mannosidase
MARKDVKTLSNPLSGAHFTIEQRLEIWGNNSAFEEKNATLEVVAFDLHGGEVSRTEEKVVLAPNSSTEFWKGLVPGQPIRTSDAQVPLTIVVGARLIDVDGTVLARYGKSRLRLDNLFDGKST